MMLILAFVNFSTLSYPRVEVDYVCTTKVDSDVDLKLVNSWVQ